MRAATQHSGLVLGISPDASHRPSPATRLPGASLESSLRAGRAYPVLGVTPEQRTYADPGGGAGAAPARAQGRGGAGEGPQGGAPAPQAPAQGQRVSSPQSVDLDLEPRSSAPAGSSRTSRASRGSRGSTRHATQPPTPQDSVHNGRQYRDAFLAGGGAQEGPVVLAPSAWDPQLHGARRRRHHSRLLALGRPGLGLAGAEAPPAQDESAPLLGRPPAMHHSPSAGPLHTGAWAQEGGSGAGAGMQGTQSTGALVPEAGAGMWWVPHQQQQQQRPGPSGLAVAGVQHRPLAPAQLFMLHRHAGRQPSSSSSSQDLAVLEAGVGVGAGRGSSHHTSVASGRTSDNTTSSSAGGMLRTFSALGSVAEGEQGEHGAGLAAGQRSLVRLFSPQLLGGAAHGFTRAYTIAQAASPRPPAHGGAAGAELPERARSAGEVEALRQDSVSLPSPPFPGLALQQVREEEPLQQERDGEGEGERERESLPIPRLTVTTVDDADLPPLAHPLDAHPPEAGAPSVGPVAAAPALGVPRQSSLRRSSNNPEGRAPVARSVSWRDALTSVAAVGPHAPAQPAQAWDAAQHSPRSHGSESGSARDGAASGGAGGGSPRPDASAYACTSVPTWAGAPQGPQQLLRRGNSALGPPVPGAPSSLPPGPIWPRGMPQREQPTRPLASPPSGLHHPSVFLVGSDEQPALLAYQDLQVGAGAPASGGAIAASKPACTCTCTPAAACSAHLLDAPAGHWGPQQAGQRGRVRGRQPPGRAAQPRPAQPRPCLT